MQSEPTYDLWATAAARAAAMTAARQEPRRHHLVPRFYLERWAGDGRVRVVDLVRGRNAYELSPAQAALETDFYRLDEPNDETSPVYWEAWLSEVEGKAAASMASIDAGGPGAMDDEAHQWLCLFLAVQMTRGRFARLRRRAMFVEQMARLLETDGPRRIAHELSAAGRSFSSSGLEELVANVEHFRADPSQLQLPRKEDLESSARTATHIAGSLMTRHVTLYGTRRALITCDEPVVGLHENMAKPAMPGGVRGTPILAFPLGPHSVLALYRRDLEPPLEPGSMLTAIETIDLNSSILANAHSFAIATAGDRIAERLYLPPEPASIRSQLIDLPKSDESLFRFWTPGRWEEQPDAPVRVVNRWWPEHVPPAPRPTAEERKIIDSWS